MTAHVEAVLCANCGLQLTETSQFDATQERVPCTSCGSTARAYHVFMNASFILRSGSTVKAKRGGEKKPYSETIDLPDFNRSRAKLVHRVRVIDRENDKYFERITDYQSSEVIHECEEPLSQHIGHGSDTSKRES